MDGIALQKRCDPDRLLDDLASKILASLGKDWFLEGSERVDGGQVDVEVWQSS